MGMRSTRTRRWLAIALALFLGSFQPQSARAEVISAIASGAALVTLGWQALLITGGAYAAAYARADEAEERDPPGTGVNGGMFTSAAYAAAQADGKLGSHQKSTAESSLGFFTFNGKVDLSDHKLGTAPGARYLGIGYARGSEFKNVSRSRPSDIGFAAGDVQVDFTTSLTISEAVLSATPPMNWVAGSPTDSWGFDMVNVLMTAYITLDTSLDPQDAIWSATLAETSATLLAGITPSLVTSGSIFNTGSFEDISQTSDGYYHTALRSPITVPISFSAQVPDSVTSFNLIVSTEIEGVTAAAIPEPSELALVSLGALGALIASGRLGQVYGHMRRRLISSPSSDGVWRSS